VLVGGILGGVFSSVEAGAITALVAFLVGAFAYRSLDLEALRGAFLRAMRLSASVFVIIAAAGPLSWVLTKLGTIRALEAWLAGYAATPVLFVVVLIGFIVVAGMIMDATANIIVLGPMLVAVCGEAGFPPIQAALVVVVGFLMGTVTPPVGVCYFTANYVAGARLERTALEMLPFIAVEVIVLFLMFATPALTLALPRALGLG
jgi:TRAP-type C4-dicarboxylate transport system permease large subunit